MSVEIKAGSKVTLVTSDGSTLTWQTTENCSVAHAVEQISKFVYAIDPDRKRVSSGTPDA